MLRGCICASLTVTLVCVGASAADASLLEVTEELGNNVRLERQYELGTEAELSLSQDEAVRLVCGENTQGIVEVLVGWSVSGTGRRADGQGILYTYVIWLDGTISGGGTFLRRASGSKRRLSMGTSPCLTTTRWGIEGENINVALIATTNRAQMKSLEAPPLSAQERVECFVRLWSEVKYNFAFFDQVPDVDWEKVLTEYLPKAREEQANYAFYRLMTRCVAQLRDGHTRFVGGFALPPEFLNRPPVLIRCVEEKAIIVELGQSEELEQSGLKRGMEVTHVDGRTVREILEQDLYPYITASTSQARNLEAYPRLLEGPADSVALVRVRDLDGKARDVTLTRSYRGVRRGWARRAARKAGEVAEGIFYLPLYSFGSPEVVDEFDRLFEEIQQARGLIIDVRDNGGGSSEYAYAIVSYLTDKPLETCRWKTRQYLPAFRAWGQDEKWYEGQHDPIEPIKGKKPFLGPVVVRTGPRTFSAAEDFLIPLHASGRATLVGEPTAGSTGQPLFVRLPGGTSVRICTKRDTYPDGREFVGVGVVPDLEVRPTRADIVAGRYADGADPLLEKGLEALKAQLQR